LNYKEIDKKRALFFWNWNK